MVNMNRILTNTAMSFLLYRVNQVACIMMCMWIATPYFRIRAGVIFLLMMFGIWLITTDLKWLTKKLTLDLVLIIIFFITFIPYIVSGSLQYGAAGPKMILVNFPIFFVGIFINHYYMYYKKDYKVLGKIAFFYLIFFTIGSLQTYFGLLQYPMASRELAGALADNPELGNRYSFLGIGGFGHIYSASFLLIASSFLLKSNRNLYTIKSRVLVLVSFISIFLMLLQASYATSLIILFLGLLSVLIVRNKFGLIILSTTAVIFILLIPKTLWNEFFVGVADVFSWNNILNEKFLDLANSFLYGSGNGQTGDRIELYITSFKTFLSNPLFGIYGPLGNSKTGLLGDHSGWVDLLGYYGLFTVIPLALAIYVNIKKHLRFYKTTRYYWFVIVIYLLILVLGIVNPIVYVYEIGFVLFFIIPAIPFMGYAFDHKKEVYKF